MLAPKRLKFRKTFRSTNEGMETRGTSLSYGDFGLKATTQGMVSSRQIESARRTLSHYTKRGGRIWIRIFPHKPITKKPPETRMGGGKGDVLEYVAVIRPGRILFEMGAIPAEMAKEAMRQAGAKLSVRTKFIMKD